MMHALRKSDDLIEFSFDSVVAPNLPFAALQRIARECLDANPRIGITGELRLQDGRLFEVVEGIAGVVMPLAARILADPRHGAIRVLCLAPTAARRFDGWRVTGFGIEDALAPAAVNLRYLVTRAAAMPGRPAIRGQTGALSV